MALAKSVTRSTLKKVQNTVFREASYIKGIKQAMEKKVKAAQQNLLKSFEKHPVTSEIRGGASSSNLSGTLGGIGNLFTYIGFSSGDKPLTILRVLLEQYEIRYHHAKGRTTINITVPTTAELFKATPMPWATGRSWAKGIETGISGLGRYLYQDSARSRSGGALQVKGRLRAGKFSNTSYLSSLLNNYYKEIRKIEKETIT
ncbi:MAG TPA: hypothetical protein EYG21_04745 [Nitrospinaceae bacterium]|nr:hypothetical protein [Nitrospinaceae bacterium]